MSKISIHKETKQYIHYQSKREKLSEKFFETVVANDAILWHKNNGSSKNRNVLLPKIELCVIQLCYSQK